MPSFRPRSSNASASAAEISLADSLGALGLRLALPFQLGPLGPSPQNRAGILERLTTEHATDVDRRTRRAGARIANRPHLSFHLVDHIRPAFWYARPRDQCDARTAAGRFAWAQPELDGKGRPSVRHDYRSGGGATWAKEANREQRS